MGSKIDTVIAIVVGQSIPDANVEKGLMGVADGLGAPVVPEVNMSSAISSSRLTRTWVTFFHDFL
jgi:hypothetical protein